MDAHIRSEFPILERKAYFNACSYGPLSRRVETAVERYLQIRREEGARWDIFVQKAEAVRTLLGRLLECPADDVSVSTSVSQSLNSLMSALRFDGPRDGIVVTDFDFPTTSQIMLAQANRGARVRRARADTAGTEIPIEEYARLIDERTLLVSVPLACYRNGVWIDVAPIIELARKRGALVLVDAYQGIGTRPVNVVEMGADFVVGGCAKYLIGSSGAAFMYVRNSTGNGLVPTATGWWAQADPNAMDIYHYVPHPTARRFEAGTPNALGLFAAEAGLELLLELGLDTVAEQIDYVTSLIKTEIDKHGWSLATPRDRHGAMLAIRSRDAPQLVAGLAAMDVILTDRDGNIRVAPHFYNNVHDVERLTAALVAQSDLLA